MRRHHAVLLALTGLLVCQPRAATAHPHDDLVPLLLIPRVDKAPVFVVEQKGIMDLKPDPVWETLPGIVVDATFKDGVVPVTLAACQNADTWFVRVTWPDATSTLQPGEEGAAATKPGKDALTFRWADGVGADGKLLPEDPRPRDTDLRGGLSAGVWKDGRWTYELRFPYMTAMLDSVTAPGALGFTVADAERGRAVETPVRVRSVRALDRRDFQADAPGGAAQGFRSTLAGKGKPPSWLVRESEPKNAGRVLVQEAQDEENDRFPLALLEGFSAKDVDLSVRFQARKGFKDRGAGVVWRVKDEKNHYILRANMLEANVVLYKMQDGLRIDLPPVGHEADYGVTVEADPATWHTLRVTAVGDRFQAYLDGRLLFDVVDKTFGEAGGVGLWTKSDSVMAFDDLAVVSLDLPK